MIDIIADTLLVLGCLIAALYCGLLSRKIKRLNQFDTGLGNAIAVLSAQVDDLQKALAQTQATAEASGAELQDLLREANDVATRLDLLLAGADDLPEHLLAPEAPPASYDDHPPPSEAPPEFSFAHNPREESVTEPAFSRRNRQQVA